MPTHDEQNYGLLSRPVSEPKIEDFPQANFIYGDVVLWLTLMNIWLLSRVAGARVKTDVTKTIHDDPIDQVDRLPCSSQVNLSPIVFTWTGVNIAWRRRGGHSSVAEICKYIKNKRETLKSRDKLS